MVNLLSKLKGRLSKLDVPTLDVSSSVVCVPEAHPSVGPISICLEKNRLTVWLGNGFHKHFDLSINDRFDLGMVVKLICDFVNERTMICSVMKPSATYTYLQGSENGNVYSLLVVLRVDVSFWSRFASWLFRGRPSAMAYKWTGPATTELAPLHDPIADDVADQLARFSMRHAQHSVDRTH